MNKTVDLVNLWGKFEEAHLQELLKILQAPARSSATTKNNRYAGWRRCTQL